MNENTPPKPIEELATEGVDWAIAEMNRREVVKLTAYLTSTDWYATRMAETGKAIPEEIIADRQAARDRISILKEQP